MLFYSHTMLIFSICLITAVVTGFSIDSLLKPLDYNWYIRELKLNIPGLSEGLQAMRSYESELRIN